jgi:membrane protein
VNKWLAKTEKLFCTIRDFLQEKGLESVDHTRLSRVHRFALFWLLVAKSFSRNRCPIRASALAYTSLLALIPMLAVAVSFSKPFLKNDEGHRISHWVDKVVDTFAHTAPTHDHVKTETVEDTNVLEQPLSPQTPLEEAAVAASQPSPTDESVLARKKMVDTINGFINRTNGSTLGVTGMVLLIFAAISMLASIEGTFNDIWGISQGRTWFARVVQYWAVITLGPVLLAVAAGLASGRHLKSTQHMLEQMPGISALVFQLLPIIVLTVTFTLFYRLMPNTRVQWSAALVGGLVGGMLWHLNSIVSVIYVSRWVTNSKIYGSLAAIPVFMVGLYFSWLILLFGAQVSYAWQNRAVYLQDKQADNVNQRGREFIALRLMECIGQRFHRALPPAGVSEIAEALAIPTRLVQQIIEPLRAARLVVQVAAEEDNAFAPARPLDRINCHDILLALRAGQGQELATRDCPARDGVFGEFERILAAEEQAASSVTVLMMVDRTERLAGTSGQPMKAVSDKTNN